MRLQLKREWAIPSAIGFACFLIGTGSGYILKGLLNKEEDVEEDEHEQLAFDEILFSAMNYLDQDVRTLMTEFNARVIEEIPNVDKTDYPRVRIFNDGSGSGDRWDWTEEKAARTETLPYIITIDEFKDGATEFRQMTLTFYEGDKVLCDEKDIPVYDHEKIVGELHFGHGSGDQNTVYIRNHQLKAEYEIIRHTGHFQVEVLGQEIEDRLLGKEIQHERRRFRE